jgi:hypothetical protein
MAYARFTDGRLVEGAPTLHFSHGQLFAGSGRAYDAAPDEDEQRGRLSVFVTASENGECMLRIRGTGLSKAEFNEMSDFERTAWIIEALTGDPDGRAMDAGSDRPTALQDAYDAVRQRLTGRTKADHPQSWQAAYDAVRSRQRGR